MSGGITLTPCGLMIERVEASADRLLITADRQECLLPGLWRTVGADP